MTIRVLGGLVSAHDLSGDLMVRAHAPAAGSAPLLCMLLWVGCSGDRALSPVLQQRAGGTGSPPSSCAAMHCGRASTAPVVSIWAPAARCPMQFLQKAKDLADRLLPVFDGVDTGIITNVVRCV